MNPEEINKRIAIACGWKKDDTGKWKAGTWVKPDKDIKWMPSEIPNYHGDLNAMHEAIESLDEADKQNFIVKLADIILYDDRDNGWWDLEVYDAVLVANATAPQRAEAFLRTIGQWEDGKDE